MKNNNKKNILTKEEIIKKYQELLSMKEAFNKALELKATTLKLYKNSLNK